MISIKPMVHCYYLGTRVYVYEWSCQKQALYLGTIVKGGCELPNVDAGN